MLRKRFLGCTNFVILFVPIIILFHCFSWELYHEDAINFRWHRITTASEPYNFIHTIEVTIIGIPSYLPSNSDYLHLEHVLFSYLNKSLTPRKLQISSVNIDQDKSKVKSRDGLNEFTVIRPRQVQKQDQIEHNNESLFKKEGNETEFEDGAVIQEESERNKNDLDRTLKSNDAETTGNFLMLQVVIDGRDYSMLQGYFKKHIKASIDAGYKEIINEIIYSSDAKEYFENITWIGVSDVIDSTDSFNSRTNSDLNTSNHDDSRNSYTNDSEDHDMKQDRNPKRRPMNAKAVEFRIISGSIFLSLCATAILSNVIRVLARKRAIRRRRIEKAIQAYESPGNVVKGISEKKFVGLLDDGDQYR